MNQLYFGDCLDVLKELHGKHPEGFIDLVYIDPPFNSKRNYNILFEDVDLSDTKAQREAFSDTWSSVSYNDTLNELQTLDLDLFKFLKALDGIRLSKGAISYLVTMSIRILYIHKVLKNTGSFYLHCDQTMSHYLKLVCDLIFSHKNFRDEIIWKRTNSLKTSQFQDRKFGIVTDTILFYTKTDEYFFDSENVKIPFTDNEILEHYPFKDAKGRFTKSPLFRSMGMGERPNLCYEYKGVSSPNKAGWKISLEKLMEYDKNGEIDWTNPKLPYRKYRPEHTKGWLVSNLWGDIDLTGGRERLGYPTQKPITLLERVLKTSSNEGDLVADFFCGCGTTIAAAQKLNRNWIGADISHLAIKLILKRLTDPYPDDKQKEILSNIEVSGFPRDLDSARELATKTDKHRIKFQDWIVEFMIGGISNQKKSGDGGYDGYLTFHKSYDGKTKGIGIIEVKSGNVGVHTLRAFSEVVKKQNADIGIFVCFEEHVTKGMRIDANAQGKLEGWSGIDKIQIITVEDLLNHKSPQLPGLGSMKHFEESTKKLETKIEEERMF